VKLFFPAIFLFLVGCSTSKNTTSSLNSSIESHVNLIKQQYAPDARTAVFTIEQKGKIIKGETNIPEAKASFITRLQSAGISFIDSIDVLPNAQLQENNFAVVTISVANLRTQPKHAAELATQATLGTPLKVLKKSSSWYLVQTPDQYISWVDAGGIQLHDSATYASWKAKEKIIYTHPFGFVYAYPGSTENKISDAVYGNVFELVNKMNGAFEVKFPDGRTGYIPIKEGTVYNVWAKTRKPTEPNFVQTAKELMGVPYLWGGTSFKGVDCSGFTKTVYFMNGLVLPRDASQQVNIGTEIDTKNGWDNLKAGDLLFFGTPAKDGKPERVVHVAMWIGNGEFIHASGRVQVASLITTAPNYDASEHKRFLRAKRINTDHVLVDLSKTFLYL